MTAKSRKTLKIMTRLIVTNPVRLSVQKNFSSPHS